MQIVLGLVDQLKANLSVSIHGFGLSSGLEALRISRKQAVTRVFCDDTVGPSRLSTRSCGGGWEWLAPRAYTYPPIYSAARYDSLCRTGMTGHIALRDRYMSDV